MEVKYINLQKRIAKIDKLSDIEKVLLKVRNDVEIPKGIVTYAQIPKILGEDDKKPNSVSSLFKDISTDMSTNHETIFGYNYAGYNYGCDYTYSYSYCKGYHDGDRFRIVKCGKSKYMQSPEPTIL